MIYYFAYGSNLHPLRLQQRVPSAELVQVASYTQHQLVFHKQGHDGSGKCNMHVTGTMSDMVYGAIYRMHADHKAVLDRFEGKGYEDKKIVLSCNGLEYDCFAYLAQQSHIVHSMKPYHWYKQLVIHGAKYLQLPGEYISRIESVESIEDADNDRRMENELLVNRILQYCE